MASIHLNESSRGRQERLDLPLRGKAKSALTTSTSVAPLTAGGCLIERKRRSRRPTHPRHESGLMDAVHVRGMSRHKGGVGGSDADDLCRRDQAAESGCHVWMSRKLGEPIKDGIDLETGDFGTARGEQDLESAACLTFKACT